MVSTLLCLGVRSNFQSSNPVRLYDDELLHIFPSYRQMMYLRTVYQRSSNALFICYFASHLDKTILTVVLQMSDLDNLVTT